MRTHRKNRPCCPRGGQHGLNRSAWAVPAHMRESFLRPKPFPWIVVRAIGHEVLHKGHMMVEFLQSCLRLLSRIGTLLSWLYRYREIYKVTGVFFTRRFPPAGRNHKYAVLVAARNEEAVIGNLMDSIRAQDYPAELVTIFVAADNCTDRTAEIARGKGAVCYERFDAEHRTKGFALQFLVEQIRRDYGVEAFEGYFIFDADNLLKGDYISRMNEAFDAGEKIITSYRNTKNFDDNWISASYGIHWLRTVRSEHRARSLFRLATRIQGTGFLFASEIIRNGWNYTSLTEDRALSADAVVQGYRIAYNNAAEFFDEQPVDLRIAMRQRIRWAKGHLQAFAESGGKLLVNIFRRGSFMSYDMLTVIFPRSLYTVFKRTASWLIRLTLICLSGKHFGAVVTVTWNALYWVLRSCLNDVVTAAYVFLMEHRRIKKIPWYKMIWFCLTFPLFDLMGDLAMCIALFTRVEWKPIPHKSTVRIEELDQRPDTDAALSRTGQESRKTS